MCAITAGQRGRRVLMLDHTNKVGKKIMMSGGGHCNFTNLYTEPGNFISQNPHFCKSALSRFTPWDFLAMVEKHGIAHREKAAGQLFCVEKAKVIVDMLLDEAAAAGVEIRLNTAFTHAQKQGDFFTIHTSQGEVTAQSLVVATGGYSVPTTGATGIGFELAQQFGLNLLKTDAALVPFTFDKAMLAKYQSLAGVACEALIENEHAAFRENILFTHRGLSGPAVLQFSTYWKPGQRVQVDLCPHEELYEALIQERTANPSVHLHTFLGYRLPKKLVQIFLEHTPEGPHESRPLATYSNQQLSEIANLFKNWQWLPAGTEGYRTAEVTVGGVDTNELSSKTMEAKKVPGLYFIGEVVDVTGQLGGFNFQWAWASGYAAGEFV
ncbi:MAG: NAD(P)/FAD-dependent oxidoreductase [Hahellaceae bacterium]|nr:NAD(P)/FAD-dependent oxidoreductase [Hahellaceae bacterium]